MKNPDDLSYLKFTRPQQRDKAVNVLLGILQGIQTDGVLNDLEIAELKRWCTENRDMLNRPSFAEVMKRLECVLADGRVDEDERADLEWVLGNFKLDSGSYDIVKADIQQLHGMLHGIAADGKIEKAELESLQEWMDERDYLQGIYPYDEIQSLIVGVLKDGRIDAHEHEALLRFFEQFFTYSAQLHAERDAERKSMAGVKELRVDGICSVNPCITFAGRIFVFTGMSERAPRAEIGHVIASKQGTLVESVPSADYLIVGNFGSPAWTFSCYGRKVEKAMAMRRSGSKICIINEVDFWDALEDSGT